MIYWIITSFGFFIFQKVTTKITTHFVYNGAKMIKYHKSWHKENDKIFDYLLDWIFL